jgi:hypothetical protein
VFELIVHLELLFLLGNAAAEAVVVATLGGSFTKPYSVVVDVVVVGVGVEPFVVVVCDGLRFLLLVGQRRAADAVDVVKVHCADFLLGVLGQDEFFLGSLSCTRDLRCVGEADRGGKSEECD